MTSRPNFPWNLCATCPTCETCGNPRAVDARSVATDMTGRAKHVAGSTGPACDDCDRHHRALVTDRAQQLTGRLM
jgi:hypothetical protein